MTTNAYLTAYTLTHFVFILLTVIVAVASAKIGWNGQNHPEDKLKAAKGTSRTGLICVSSLLFSGTALGYIMLLGGDRPAFDGGLEKLVLAFFIPGILFSAGLLTAAFVDLNTRAKAPFKGLAVRVTSVYTLSTLPLYAFLPWLARLAQQLAGR